MLIFSLSKLLLLKKLVRTLLSRVGINAIMMGLCTLASGCGGIFRNHNGVFLLAFVEKLNSGSSIHAKFATIIKVIAIGISHGWLKLQIEINSSMVVKAFFNPLLVHWKLRSICNFCMDTANFSNLAIMHIYREGNTCADYLALFGEFCAQP